MTQSRTDRWNRILLGVICVLVIALGIGALLHSTGLLGAQRRGSSVIADPTAAWYGANGSWLWPVIAGIALVVVLLAVWWASAQIRMQGSSHIVLERAATGSASVAGGHLADCIEHDVAGQQGVARARARITTSDSTVHVWLTVWVGPPYDVGRTIAMVTKNVLPNVRGMLDSEQPTTVRTHVTVEAAETAISRLA